MSIFLSCVDSFPPSGRMPADGAERVIQKKFRLAECQRVKSTIKDINYARGMNIYI
jgi:hypothetical protein